MMFKLATFLSVSLAAIQGAHSQVSTASLFPVVDANGGSLQGQVAGTGADGTTYVLSGSPPTSGSPVTLTLVQDASHVSEFAAESTGSASAEFHVECGFDTASNGICTLEQILANGANVTTIVQTDTGVVTLTPVLVSASGATPASTSTTPSATDSASATQSSSAAASHVAAGNVIGAMCSLLLAFAFGV